MRRLRCWTWWCAVVLSVSAAPLQLDPRTAELVTCHQSDQSYNSDSVTIRCSPKDRPGTTIIFSAYRNDNDTPIVECRKYDYKGRPPAVHCEHQQGYFRLTLHDQGGISVNSVGGASIITNGGGGLNFNGGNVVIRGGFSSTGDGPPVDVPPVVIPPIPPVVIPPIPPVVIPPVVIPPISPGVVTGRRIGVTPRSRSRPRGAKRGRRIGANPRARARPRTFRGPVYQSRSPSGAAVYTIDVNGYEVHVVRSASGATVITISDDNGDAIRVITSASGSQVIQGGIPGVDTNHLINDIFTEINQQAY